MPVRYFIPCVVLFALHIVGCTSHGIMSPTPHPQDPWFIRSHFGDDAKWTRMVDAVTAPTVMFGDRFYANIRLIDDPTYKDRSPLQIVNALPDDYPQYFVFVVDDRSLDDTEQTVLVVNFLPQFDQSYDIPPRQRTDQHVETFRAAASTIQSISNNLSIGNMGFEEFAESIDEDGVFRGFPMPDQNSG